MAKRPVFLPVASKEMLVKTVYIEFQWFPGFAKVQKKKSLDALHTAIRETLKLDKILEISSKSDERLGEMLSAFNLSFVTRKYELNICVECAFQGSKVFKHGGPYQDLYEGTARAAKKDSRIRESGQLTGFKFFGQAWPLNPQTAFYDWLYINALKKNQALADEIKHFQGFTDIEFNPQKSINCQAYSAALYLGLEKSNLLDEATSSQESFIDIMRSMNVSNARENFFEVT